MFRFFRHHVSVVAFTGMMADMVLLFVALLLAGATQAGVRSGEPIELAQVVLYAAHFALVVSLMYSFAGLYRPTPIGIPTLWGRTVVAMLVGGWLTYMMLRLVVEGEYLKLLISSALLYALIGLVFVRAALYWLKRVSARQRVLIVGTGPRPTPWRGTCARSPARPTT